MLKKIFFIILSLSLLTHCEYKPVYSKQNNVGLKIMISGFTGDKDINNFIASNVNRNSKNESNDIVKIDFNTNYTKKILAKNSAGTITDYQSDVVTTFVIRKDDNTENFVVRDKFNFKKMTDKYEEKNYELNIKRNLANSISQKLILRLASN
tara:strand:+ start:37 stop:492 length:456 start_codon:yes stop_codon:yes gene_type:complete